MALKPPPPPTVVKITDDAGIPSPQCRKTPTASCFGHHLFICKKHPRQCYTRINPCQLCEGEERRQAKAEKMEASRAKALEEQQKAQQKEAARQKFNRKNRWTDTQKSGRITAMRAKSG
ncbi:hypothetical protein LA080_016295 [Diaporthe eres]|nr:hypothetical protein LA080_016295 [Diaporthe eres]